MPQLTPVVVANMALGYLRQGPITSLTDHTPQASVVNRYWQSSRDAFLQEHPWSFAKKSKVLARLDAEVPTWKYCYACPEDFLSMIRIMPHRGVVRNFFDDAIAAFGRPVKDPVRFEIMAGDVEHGVKRIVACDSAGVAIEYTGSGITLDMFSPLALEALSRRLAFDISIALKHNANEVQILAQAYQVSLMGAKERDAEWRSYPPRPASNYTRARI